MTRLGLGLAAVGRPAYLTAARSAELGDDRSVAALRARTAELLDAAYAAGVRYVDAARSYGRAEEFLAAWRASRPDVTDLIVASKWGYTYVGDWRTDRRVHEVKDHSVQAFRRQWAETRALLGDTVAVYQIHSVTPESPALDDAELLGELARLRDTGVRVGVSTSGPAQADSVRRALGVVVGGAPLFSVVQSTWNVLEPSVGPALAEAADAGVAVVLKECLANGRLAATEPDGTPGVARAADVAKRLGLPLDEFAMAVALAQPWAGRVLTGAVTTDQIARNRRAAEAGILPADAAAQLADLAEAPADYWATRSRREWR
ncbi:aldo/keto reductase [Cryptosporangium aurantiacum]|uniref:Predicted oxidoreductase n=1 Tax=Cryptosporangium aurantiacum TaxID=134849 RepID=A0A1M7TU81_9ACTN|nr:aldo/keto reductase [Cryptosporangium aurantiacum]SHN74260.1 Predicted oxidoreductase [Cryptosporangium aurantiacum]